MSESTIDHARWVRVAPKVPELHVLSDALSLAGEQQRIRSICRRLLGDFPERKGPPAITPCGSEQRNGFTVERFTFDNGTGWTIPGVCYRPDGKGPFPAVLWHHWHGGDYRGLEHLDAPISTPEPPGPTLAKQGYVVLGVETPIFGQLNGRGPDGLPGGDGELSLAKYEFLYGRSSWGLTVHNDLCALDLLAARPDVIPDRIGAAGISMGCFRALWTAAMDPRIRATVAICCMVRMQNLIAAGSLHYHGIYYYVPGMLRHFDMEAIVSCIAPRALLSINGELDPLTPLDGIHAVEKAVRPAWELGGAGEKLKIEITPGIGHQWTPTMWTQSMEWFRTHLQKEGY